MNYPSIQFEQAVGGMCHGTIAPEQLRELADLLRRDAAARDAYLLAVELHARLASENALLADSARQSGSAVQWDARSDHLRRWRIGRWAGAAALVLIALAGWWMLSRKHMADPPVGVAVRVLAAEGQAAQAWPAGQSRTVDRVRFSDGLLRLQLEKSGVVLTVPAPVDLSLVDPMRARIERGQVIADVGEGGKGFVIETPQGHFVDLGTTFGIDAKGDDTTDLVVFKGKVQAYPDGKRNTPLSTVIEGEAVRLAQDKSLARIPNIVSNSAPGPWSTLPPRPERCVIESVRDNLRSPGDRVFYQIIPGGMKEGVQAYVGPAHLWKGRTASGLPPSLLGADMVRTFPDDSGKKNLQITVRLSRPAMLYVLFETRHQQGKWRQTPGAPDAPEWLERDFHKIGDAVGLDDAGQLQPGESMTAEPGKGHLVTFDVWEKKILEPGEVTLGAPTGPEGWKNWMYGIVAKPLEKR